LSEARYVFYSASAVIVRAQDVGVRCSVFICRLAANAWFCLLVNHG
jgi:hypothetical protein